MPGPEFSPDGRWLAYGSDEPAGRGEVLCSAVSGFWAPATPGVGQTAADRGPRAWNPAGGELGFGRRLIRRAGTAHMMVVDVRTSSVYKAEDTRLGRRSR